MIIPVGTDAPLYHRPIGTIGLIVANAVIYFWSWSEFGPEDLDPYALQTGQGLHLLQWVTHGFLHLDILHLIGNVIFLWTFGLIVEGKIGTPAFLGLYLGVDVLVGATVQVLFMNVDEGAAVGASGVIYALIGMAMIWAPKNELSCFYLFFIGFRIITGVKEVAIYLFSIFYIAWEGIVLFFTGLTMSSAIGHGTGALWGTLIGVGLVKASLVDCDGWDVFTLWKKRREVARSGTGATRRGWGEKRRGGGGGGGAVEGPGPDRAAGGALNVEGRIADARRRVAHMLDQGMAPSALQAHEKAADLLPGYRLEEPEHLRLIRMLLEQGEAADAVRPMRDYVARYPDRSPRVRLRLAQDLIDRQQRPMAAARLLKQIPAGTLDESLETARRRLLKKAKAMAEEGVLEVEGDD